MKKIVCYCEHSFEINFPEIVDLEKDPAVMDSILTGDFMNVACPGCKTILKPELPFKLVDQTKQIDISFIPELDRTAFLMNKLDYDIGNPRRVVIGYKELVEKLSLIKADLDDQVIEAVKYYILSKAQDSSPGNEIKIYFSNLKGDSLAFYIEGLKKDEIGEYKINLDFYKNVAVDLDKKKTDPTFSAFLTPPYVSLNKVYME